MTVSPNFGGAAHDAIYDMYGVRNHWHHEVIRLRKELAKAEEKSAQWNRHVDNLTRLGNLAVDAVAAIDREADDEVMTLIVNDITVLTTRQTK